MEVNRRQLAKGTIWAAPVIMVAAPAPAIAASPCARYQADHTLPASAFTVTYVIVTNESQDLSGKKQVAVDFGFRMSDEALSCGVASGARISSSNASGTSRVQMDNGRSYDVTNGGSVPANGFVGGSGFLCQQTYGRTAACGTSGASAYNVVNSVGTGNNRVTRIALVRTITVDGYSPTVVYFNATIPLGVSSGADRIGTSLSVTSTSPF